MSRLRRSRVCRCGHHALAHRGPDTECFGLIPNGKNAVGVKQSRGCDCKMFRPTARGLWKRLWLGTEELP